MHLFFLFKSTLAVFHGTFSCLFSLCHTGSIHSSSSVTQKKKKRKRKKYLTALLDSGKVVEVEVVEVEVGGEAVQPLCLL